MKLLEHHGSADPVAFGEGGTRTAADLLADAAAIAAALPAPDTDRHVLMVFKHDRYAFAATLLGAWAAGHVVALPPNVRGETVTTLLEQAQTQCVVHDTAAGGYLRASDLMARREGVAPLVRPRVPEGRAVVAFTSGSTGQTEAWPKTAAQLLKEVEVLARTFAIAPGERIVATVPPTHLYGLLFSVLLPLRTGGAFGRETPLHPETVARCVAEARAETLVSVPVHLRAADALPAGALAGLRRVFSSTAPLPEATAERFTARHGLAITEIFGSTETGGIAWRQRHAGEAWRPLEGVRCSVDDEGHLVVDSPFLDPAGPRPHHTSDLAEAGSDGGFVHRGRADGVVKVGGRRVSLREMEDWLLRQEGVEDAAVVAVPEPTRGSRILAAVVAPTRSPAELKHDLASRFEPSTLPRRLLAVDALPRESNGKLQRARVLGLFGLDPAGVPLVADLRVGAPRIDREGEVTTLAVEVEVPRGYVWFEGHFPGYPVMAGVVQLHELVLPLVADQRPEWGPLAAAHQLKFLERIRPGDALRVSLRLAAAEPECDFRIERGDRVCSAGRLRFAGSTP